MLIHHDDNWLPVPKTKKLKVSDLIVEDFSWVCEYE